MMGLQEDESRLALKSTSVSPETSKLTRNGDKVPVSKIPFNVAALRQPPVPVLTPSMHINILIPSMTFGGAERCVYDIVTGLERRHPTGKLFVLHNLVPSYSLEGTDLFPVLQLEGKDRLTWIRTIALEVLTSPTPILYTHLIRAEDLRMLWDYGVITIPVVHNSVPGWQDSPDMFADRQVPFIISVSEDVRKQLITAGCKKPIVVIRHELQRWRVPEDVARDRNRIRRRHGVRDNTLLIGMVGQFKAHKAYTRAVRVLREILKFKKAKLMIIGGWDHDYGAGRVTYAATIKLALELGVLPDLLVLGPVHPVEPYYAAFDIFLNTSIYEGLSIATLEAAQSGCPIVSANVGGQREIVPERTVLIDDPSDVGAYVAAIRSLIRAPHPQRLGVSPPRALDLVPRLWGMLANYGVPLKSSEENRFGTAADILFVTSNLNPGGAQRSLVNLLTHVACPHRAWLCVLDRVLGDHFIEKLGAAGIPVLGLSPKSAQLDRMEQLLAIIARLRVRTICFWNVEAPVKLLVAKVLALRGVRLVDVSPGPMLFAELDESMEFQRRIAFSAAEYLERLDCFIAKYRGGEPPARYRATAKHVEIIPNGVSLPESVSDQPVRLRPAWADPRFAIVTCCRIVPNKRIEWLVEMMRFLTAKIRRASLTIVGGVDQRHIGYWESLCAIIGESNLTNVHFVGPNADVFCFLREFKVFVMVSHAQGCPNASLEAMAAGLPVVANNDGGTYEQIVHGRTGYLVKGDNPKEMADRVAELLRNPARAKRFGEAGRRRVKRSFSIQRMVDSYTKILWPIHC